MKFRLSRRFKAFQMVSEFRMGFKGVSSVFPQKVFKSVQDISVRFSAICGVFREF